MFKGNSTINLEAHADTAASVNRKPLMVQSAPMATKARFRIVLMTFPLMMERSRSPQLGETIRATGSPDKRYLSRERLE